MKAAATEFRLPAEDESYLEGLGIDWEMRVDKGPSQNQSTNWLILHNWKLPNGYNVAEANLALRIPGNYSDAQIDMVYFNPSLSRADGKAIGALSAIKILTEDYQQWSRHRTGQNPWLPGIDNIASHLAAVDHWLRRELEGR